MNLQSLKSMVGRQLNLRAIRRHRSRIGWRVAPMYSDYLTRCRREAPASDVLDPQLRNCVEQFNRDGVTSFQNVRTEDVARGMSRRIAEREAKGETPFRPLDQYGGQSYAGSLWQDFPEIEQLFRGDVGAFLRGYFKSSYKVFYGTMYRSVALEDGRMGSQQWHSDGGPGICVNVMFYLHDMTVDDGALEALPWPQSMEIYRHEHSIPKGEGKRDALTDYYDRVIPERYQKFVVRPVGGAGLVVPFLNNTLHRGGFPSVGRTRTAVVFHCYPSHQPTDFELYRTKGIEKVAPYPKDPAAIF